MKCCACSDECQRECPYQYATWVQVLVPSTRWTEWAASEASSVWQALYGNLFSEYVNTPSWDFDVMSHVPHWWSSVRLWGGTVFAAARHKDEASAGLLWNMGVQRLTSLFLILHPEPSQRTDAFESAWLGKWWKWRWYGREMQLAAWNLLES